MSTPDTREPRDATATDAPNPDAPNPDAAEFDALLEPSSLPYGLPRFDRVRDADVVPAIRAAMADHAAEIAAIVANPEAASPSNTCVALEASGQALGRATAIFFGLLAPDETAERAAALEVLAPELERHFSEIWSDPALYARVRAASEAVEASGEPLDDETRRLVARQLRDLRRGGASLDDDDRAELLDIDARLGALTAEFGRNLQRSTRDSAVHVTDAAQLVGIPDAERAAFAAAAREAGEDGWLIALQLPTVQPLAESAADPALRARLAEASARRGRTEGADNTEVVLEMVRLRARRARLLGYRSHADYVIEIETAGTPEKARGLLESVAGAAARNARAEAADLAAAATPSELTPDGGVSAADWTYLARRVREERFALDSDAVRPYFELESVLRDGVLHAASELYGLEFRERPDLQGYLPDVRVVEVPDVGLILLDYFHRPTKRGGAWMTEFVAQSRLLGTRPVVVNVLGLTRPAPGEPVLLSADEVATLFHEFGHALHGLLSDVEYPVFSGTNVPRDFVEFPSQLNEMWADEDAVLDRFGVPTEMRSALREAARFGQGHATVEYLGAALIDLAWHSLTVEEADAVTDVDAFEADVLARAGLDVPGIAPRYRSRYFQHIFGGGYAAGYYAYLWAEVLDADAAEHFRAAGTTLAERRATAEALRGEVLSRGGAIDFAAAYRAFRGAEPSTAALLRRRGLE